MLKYRTIRMIKQKASEGLTAYQISKDLGISKNTAARYMAQDAPGKPKYTRASKLDPYKSKIDELMERGIFNCMVILEHLQAAGYDGGISILKEYVHPRRPPRAAPAVRRYESECGRQAQMDWGICTYLDAYNHPHKVPAFTMILGHSRAKYVEFTSRCDLRSLLRCMINAFVYYGGVPQEVLTDNMKTVIIAREDGKPVWNPQFEAFAAEMGFMPKVCQPRRPQTKGKVERLVRYTKENFFPGRFFRDIEDLNRQVLEWCRKVDSKPNGSTGRIPLQEMEAENLRQLPEKVILDRHRFETRLVSREGLISFDGIRYGVPWQYSGREVQVRLLDGQLEIYDGNVMIASHPVSHASARILYLPGQYKGLAERKGIAYPLPAAVNGPSPVEIRDLFVYDALIGGPAHG